MKKNSLLFIAVLSMIYTCKGNKSDNDINKDVRQIEIDQGKLQVFLDGIITNDAKIMLSYQYEGVTQSIYGNTVKGKPNMLQRVSFIFPEKVVPSDFYMVFNESNNIVLEKIVMNMNDDRIIIKDSAFYEYFLPSKTMTVEDYTLKISKLDTLRASKSLMNRITNRYSKHQ